MLKRRRRMTKEINKKKCIKKTKEYKNSFFNYLREELNNCTTHGLPYIFNPRMHFVERVFWLISFAGSVTFIVLLLSAQYTRFINSPTVMSVEMNYFDWNISYPAITLCPFHKINNTLYRRFINENFNNPGLEADAFLWRIGTVGLHNLDVIYLDVPENISAHLHPNTYSKVAAEIFIQFPNMSLTTNTNWKIPLELVMTEVGMCHAINSNVAVYDNPLKWQEENQKYARTNVELTIYEGDFMAQITNYTSNYKVYIHHPDEPILVTSPSYNFDNEGFVTLGLSVWSTRISNDLRPMSIGLRKCRFVNEPLNMRYQVYSYNHCILECRIGVILELCGCVPHFYKPLPSERVCTINEIKCVRNHRKEIISLTIPKNLEKAFGNSKKLLKAPKDCGCVNNCEMDIYRKDKEHLTIETRGNRLEVGITFFPKIRVVRDIIFHNNDILLRSGGVINLFIGSSVISILELFVIVGKLLLYCVFNCRKIFK